MDALSLVARLTLDSSGYDEGLDNASGKAQQFSNKTSTFGRAMKGAGVAIAAVGSATAALTTAVAAGVSQTAAYGDNIDKMSQKLGMSATAYQEWDAIMQHAGTSIDSMQAGMKTLASAAETGKESFDKLGISQEQIASMSQEELFSATISALQNVSDETERTYLAGQLLGRGATELGPLLNMTAEETEGLRQRVHEIGGVMSDEAVAAAAAYQDSLQDMQTSFSGLKRNLLSEFMPSITTVMDGLTELFSGGDGIGKISEGINGFVDNLSGMLPKIMETGTQIIMALGDAIVTNLPVITEAATQTILTLFTGIVDNLPMLVSAGLQMLLTLATGIADSLPELIPTIVDVVLQIVETLTDPNTLGALVDASIAIIIALAEGLIDALPRLIEAIPVIIQNLLTALGQNVPKLLAAGVQLVISLVGGLIQAIPQLVAAVPQLITALVNGFASYATSMVKSGAEIFTNVKEGFMNLVSGAANWGRDLINNFINGIRQMWTNLRNTVSNVASTVRSFLGFSEPEEGPLSNFHTYAPDMMKLFAEGIRDNTDLVTDQIAKSFDFDAPVINQRIVGQTGGQYSSAALPVINLTALLELDGVTLARRTYQYNVDEIDRHGGSLVIA